jgi:hypothetical protein
MHITNTSREVDSIMRHKYTSKFQVNHKFVELLSNLWNKAFMTIPLIVGACTPSAVIAIIQGMGFTTAGITAGSTAATLMSFGGGTTTAGGLVATLQSIGALGALSAAGTALAIFSGIAISSLTIFGLMIAIKLIQKAYQNNQVMESSINKQNSL